MFYRPEDGHDLPHNPFNALITPRPIGWISTKDGQGRSNLAPYSFFNGAAYVPPQVMFASTGAKEDQDGTKDSLANIRETGVFCVNICDADSLHQMNTTSAGVAAGIDEFETSGLAPVPCETIDCMRIQNAPASMECRMTNIIKLEGDANFIVTGTLIGIHMRDSCIVDGRFDVTTFKPLARLGYRDYTIVREVFELQRPDD